MKKIIAILITILSIQLGNAQTSQFFTKANSFFKTYVKNGRVDYKSIKNSPKALDELMKMASTTKVSTSNPKTYQSFYINAYNLSVIKGVVSNYPIKSPLDVKGFFDKKTYTISGKKVTLNHIENKLLRAKFPNEARFHFALVCAGIGCPPIIPEAYVPKTLNAQLDRQTKRSLNNPNFIKVKGKKVQISQIFEWYKVDFTRKGNEVDFINKYRKTPIPSSTKVSYYPYDWRLNIAK